jgi:hypothetical protein
MHPDASLLSIPARIPPCPLTWPRPQRLPGGYCPRALPGLRHVGHTGEQPTELDGGSKLATLVEGGADGGGLCLRDDEHLWSMGTRASADK